MRVSRVGASRIRSERPVPRRSKHDEARERRQPVVERPHVRTLELDVKVAGEAMDEHEIDRPFTLDGVGDGDVAAPGVANLRLHPDSLARPFVPGE